jgi:hypothetical protein
MGTMGMESFTGSIYKIHSPSCDGVYVGSTSQTLNQRLSNHKKSLTHYENNNDSDKYMTSFEIVKHGDVEITLLHSQLFDDLPTMHRLEGEYIQSVENCINKKISGRTPKEYYQCNREQIREYGRQYQHEHKNHLNMKHTCEICGGKYATKHKTTHSRTKKHIKAEEELK